MQHQVRIADGGGNILCDMLREIRKEEGAGDTTVMGDTNWLSSTGNSCEVELQGGAHDCFMDQPFKEPLGKEATLAFVLSSARDLPLKCCFPISVVLWNRRQHVLVFNILARTAEQKKSYYTCIHLQKGKLHKTKEAC